MSHYGVMVLTTEKPTEELLGTVLAPYDENMEVEPYREDVAHPAGKFWSVAKLRKEGLLPEGDLTWEQVREAHLRGYPDSADEVEAKGGALHIYAMPETPKQGNLVDVHFINVGFTELAADRDRFKRLLLAALNGPGEFADITVERMAGGPSYIEIGGWIGSQDLALRLLALGELCELWRVLTPARVGITGPEADQLAGNGFVTAAPVAGFADLLAAVA